MTGTSDMSISRWNEDTQIRAAVFGVSRLRLSTDGTGVTTLVCFMDCPLRCRLCLNPVCHEGLYESDGVTFRPGIRLYTPKDLYDRVRIDNIYFQATGGGVCFGGGEPGLQWRFIREFRRLCGPQWKITLETSLHLGVGTILALIPLVDHWIVDVKDLNPEIYERYTDVKPLLDSRLRLLREKVDPAGVTVRVPHIPGYNTPEDVAETIRRLRVDYDFTDIDEFEYIQLTPNKNR